MPSSQQTPHSPHGGKASSKTHPATTGPPTGVASEPETSGGPFRHASTGSTEPRPKWETPQDELEPQADDVTTSAESRNLGERYVPGSAAGTAAPTQPLRFTRGR
jgi:hypothetical protein